MMPRQQTAGTLGILAGISLAILFVLFLTSGATPQKLADPAQAMPYLQANAGRLKTIAVFDAITIGLAVVFLAGLAAWVREKTPTRATAVLYFGILGVAGYGLGGLLWWTGVPGILATTDQVAASHAWVAINQLNNAFNGFGDLFVGLSILLAGWAIVGGGKSASLGWYGVIAGIIVVLAVVAPQVQVLFLGSFVLMIIWLLWAGNALRTSM